jgi:hypothetical protein
MNKATVLEWSDHLCKAAARAGFANCTFAPLEKESMVVFYSKDRWPEAAAMFTSHRGKVDLTKAGAEQKRLEKMDKGRLKDALRAACSLLERKPGDGKYRRIIARNSAHHDKLVEIAPGCVALNR